DTCRSKRHELGMRATLHAKRPQRRPQYRRDNQPIRLNSKMCRTTTGRKIVAMLHRKTITIGAQEAQAIGAIVACQKKRLLRMTQQCGRMGCVLLRALRSPPRLFERYRMLRRHTL